jgi:uncharacterized protein
MSSESDVRRPTVAVLGASRERAKYGNKSVRAHVAAGYDVYPVNPHVEEVEGLPCVGSLADVPVERLDRITVYVPPAIGLTLLDEIAAANAEEVWFNPGSESPPLLRRARELGLDPITACSIVDVGRSPAEFP